MNPNRATKVPLSPVDTAWLRMEDPTNLMMITGFFVFDQPLRFETLRSILEQKLLKYRRFKQRVLQPRPSFITPYWEDDPDFDIDAHLHRIALPAPGDQRMLQSLVNDYMSTPLDFSKPLWQFHLVENYGDGCVLLCRLHHCIGDGIALMKVLLSLTDDEPFPKVQSEEPVRVSNQRRPKSPFERMVQNAQKRKQFSRALVKKGISTITDPSRLAEAIKFGTDSSVAFANLLLMSPDPQTPLKGKLGVMKRCTWSQPISLADVKEIGKVTGGTVNDVLLTAVSGALGRYLRQRGESTRGLNFRAVVPVNLRPIDEEPKLGNTFGLVFLSLPVGIDDPLDRLNELKRRMDGKKGTPEAIVSFGILNAIGIATAEVEDIVVDIFGVKATAVMTNVPGPSEVRYFGGLPIRQLMFWVPQSGRLGLGVSILSYAGEVLVGIATDSGLIPDPESIIEAYHTEYEDLFDLVRLAREADAETEIGLNQKGQCQAFTKKGRQCRNRAQPSTSLCYLHQQP